MISTAFTVHVRENRYTKAQLENFDYEKLDAMMDKFHTGLGFAMMVIKHQAEDADAIIMATNHKKIDRETAEFLNKAVNLKLVYEEKTGGVDMCKALERRYQEKEVTEAIQGMRKLGANGDIIIKAVMEMFSVTKEYVIALLETQVT